MINLFIYRKNISNIYKKFRKSVPKIIYFIKKYNKNQLNLNPRVMQPGMATASATMATTPVSMETTLVTMTIVTIKCKVTVTTAGW